MSNKFEYKYEAPSLEERKEIDSIRQQYLPKDKNVSKMEELRNLHNKVKNVPMIWGISLGVVGILFFGTSMTFFLEWSALWYCGIPFAIIGTILIALAYPVYKKIEQKYKDKYGKQILELSNELLNEDK